MVGSIGDAPRVTGAPQGVTLDDAARAFEALFLEKLLEFGNRPLAGLKPPFGGSSAERSYRQLFLQEVASRVAERPVGGPQAAPTRSPLGFATQIIGAGRRNHQGSGR